MQRWDDTPWIKLYRTSLFGSWHTHVSLPARGLFDELLLQVDRTGMLPIGRGRPADQVARAVNGEPDYVAPYLDELLEEGCLVLGEYHGERVLVVRNFCEAQAAKGTPRVRMSEMRARARDQATAARRSSEGRQLGLALRNGPVMDAAIALRSDVDVEEKRSGGPSGPVSPSASPTTTTTTAAAAVPGAPGSPEWEALRSRLRRGSDTALEPAPQLELGRSVKP